MKQILIGVILIGLLLIVTKEINKRMVEAKK
jgi:hypothetical protein